MRGAMKKAGKAAILLLLLAMACVGVGMYVKMRGTTTSKEDFAGSTDSDPGTRRIQGFAGESAEDASIDFAALKKINPEIFAWVHIPDTDIDCPVLQSEQSDVYYESHNARGEEDDAGAVYIELANLKSMCDFNTVLHGKTGGEADGLFADLYRFADPAFFEEHEYVYVYLDGNLLTYEIFAAYERENTSLIRTYDFTYLSGCRQFLSDLYGNRDREKNVRKGWENVSARHYIITLTTRKEENAKRQFVVVAVLVEDAAGVINRVVAE